MNKTAKPTETGLAIRAKTNGKSNLVVGPGGVRTFNNFNGVVCPTHLKPPIDD